MKNSVLLILTACLLTPLKAFTHPAQRIEIAADNKLVNISVKHRVSDPASHYINQITVSLNGKEIIKQTFLLQSGNEQNVSYTVPSLKAGDAIDAEANCSKGGRRKESIAIK
ncbi:MAG: hypothetical protein ABH858_00630 [Candidatus Omnitrophota bacterium]